MELAGLKSLYPFPPLDEQHDFISFKNLYLAPFFTEGESGGIQEALIQESMIMNQFFYFVSIAQILCSISQILSCLSRTGGLPSFLSPF